MIERPELLFKFRLAQSQGKTITELDNALGDSVIDGTPEFYWWIAFHNLEPFGQEWRQTARICSAVLQPHLKKGKKIKEDSFLPVVPHKHPRTKQDPNAMANQFRANCEKIKRSQATK